MAQIILQGFPTLNQDSIRIKYLHLSTENNNLVLTIKELEEQICSLRKINAQLLDKSPNSIQILINELSKQNLSLERSLFRLTKNNEELSCNILMKNQLICESQSQYRQMIAGYEEKIYELRLSLQNKETIVSTIEEKNMEEKDEQIGSTNRVNFMYFNEMYELKLTLDRYNIQNSQLKYILALKDEQLQKTKEQLSKCINIIEKVDNWQLYKKEIMNQHKCDKTNNKKEAARMKLQQQLTRFDTKYKNLSSTKTLNTMNQVTNAKFYLTHMNREKYKLQEQNIKLLKIMNNKDRQHKVLQQGYKKLSNQIRNCKIQCDFYRNNFKQLSKVTTQRKIKYYDQYYEEMLPKLQYKLHQRKNIIDYWKYWYKTYGQNIKTERSIFKSAKKPKNTHNSSCSSRFNYIRQSKTKICHDKSKEQAIFSFINETHNVDSFINYTGEVGQQANNQQQYFDGQISVIIKPQITNKQKSSNFKKKNLSKV